MNHSINRVILWCGLLALAVGGCQGKQTWNLAPVEGTVTKNGRPLAGIQVFFLADVEAGTQGPRASGTTDEAGHYRLRTDGGDDGAVVGSQRVCLHDSYRASLVSPGLLSKEAANSENIQKELNELKEAASNPPRVWPSYGNFNETPLRAEVGREPLIFDIAIP